MKKYLKILLVISSIYLIFNVNNVFAYCSKSLTITKEQAIIVNTYGMDKETVMQFVDNGYYSGTKKEETIFIINSIYTLRDYYEKNLKEDYKYYFISYRTYNNYVSSYGGYAISSIYLNVFNDENIDTSVKGYFSNSHNHNKETYFNPFNVSYAGVSDYTYYEFSTGRNNLTLGGGTKYTNSNNILSTDKTNIGTNYSTYFETNYSFDIYLNDNDNSYILSGLTYDDKLYLPGDYITNSINGLGYKLPIKYKTGFISSDSYTVLGKVSVDFSETDTNNYKYNKAQIKLQYGSNDFTKENIPIFNSYKIYGKMWDTDTWVEVEDFGYNRTFEVTDATFDYVEGTEGSGTGLADATITFTLNFNDTLVDLSTTCPYFSDWRIEFYFDNTQNGYIYVYDGFNVSDWTDTAKFLRDYTFYYFPSNYKYAFITNQDSDNVTGSIYYSSSNYFNQNILLRAQLFDLKTKVFSKPLIYQTYKDSYQTVGFSYSQSEKMLVLTRNTEGSYQTVYDNIDLKLDGSFLDFIKTHIKVMTQKVKFESNNSVASFYLPKGYHVYFTNNTTVSVITDQGVVDIDLSNSDNTAYDDDTITSAEDFNANILNNIDLSFLVSISSIIKPIFNIFTKYEKFSSYLILVIISAVIILVLKAIRK